MDEDDKDGLHEDDIDRLLEDSGSDFEPDSYLSTDSDEWNSRKKSKNAVSKAARSVHLPKKKKKNKKIIVKSGSRKKEPLLETKKVSIDEEGRLYSCAFCVYNAKDRMDMIFHITIRHNKIFFERSYKDYFSRKAKIEHFCFKCEFRTMDLEKLVEHSAKHNNMDSKS